MVWFVFALLAAFFRSMVDVSSKLGLKNVNEYIVAWSFRIFALLFLIPLLFLIKIPTLGSQFWIALLISGGLNVITSILYIKAIKFSDLSNTIPMVNFTPLFLLITSPFILNEFPNLFGVIGIFIIVIGSYILNIKEKHKGYFSPFKALLTEKGPRLMLLVAIIWSITSNFDKIGVLNSSPIFFAISLNVFTALFIFPIMLYKSRISVYQIPINMKILIPIGLFNALSIIFEMTAYSMTLVAFVIAIKRTSTIMSVLFGYWIFKEKGFKERLFGAIIMVMGVLLILLS